MNIIDAKKLQKLTYWVNGGLTAFVISFVVIFKLAQAPFLFYVSLAALCFYFPANYLIYKNRLDLYLFGLYFVLTMFMFMTTIGVGINSGFQMYCLSMIPLLFYFDYLSEQLGNRRMKPMLISVFIAVAYLGCTSYVLMNGTIYEISRPLSVYFLVSNSLWVINLLMYYSSLMVKAIRSSEDKLRMQALVDKLTGLYNRHFMIDHLEKVKKGVPAQNWISIIDIDNFKSVNDTYGHNAGDNVLIGVADAIRSVCQDCTFARWGGEEFLITSSIQNNPFTTLDRLRSTIEEKVFQYEETDIRVTITAGVCMGKEAESLDEWIQRADNYLYEGKHAGKNRIIGIEKA